MTKGKVEDKPTGPPAGPQVVIVHAPSMALWRAAALLAVAAIWSPVSQLMLSPTHGAIPASKFHNLLSSNISVLTAPLDIVFLYLAPFQEKRFFLPVLAFGIPALYHLLTPAANYLGPAQGAALCELVGFALLEALTFNVTWQAFKPVIPRSIEEPFKTFSPQIVAFAIFKAVEIGALKYVPALIGTSFLLTRPVLPAILGLTTAALLPSKYLLYAAAPIFHTVVLNPHTPLPLTAANLNATLASADYSLLAREEGLTGYMSVLQNNKEGFRVLRCDHSLLGGEWIYGMGRWLGGEGFHDRRAIVGEPIYGVFSMLEAVRLVRTVEGGKLKSSKHDDKPRNALVIGLGVGSTPAALVAHGINTTVVEIDPVVYKLAREHFTLPLNHTAIIQDATQYVKYTDTSFDYVIHDVFTGGAEPVELFTLEFIQALHDLLKPKGVIAINYAGDLLLPSTSLIVRTVLHVFPNCRLYREHPAQEDSTNDFTNMIFFCRRGDKPFAFREPSEADYLGSLARRSALVPQHEIDLNTFDKTGASTDMPDVLTRNNTKPLTKWRHRGAAGHWELMRSVLPPVIWENW